MKICRMCGVEKPKTEFGKNSGGKDNLRSHCKPCKSEKDRAYAKANADKIAAKNHAWAYANPEKKAAIAKAWREANRENITKKQRAAYEANPKKVAAINLAWRESNTERYITYAKSYRKNNPEMMAAYQRKRRAIKRKATGNHTAANIKEIFDKQSGLCANCRTSLFKSGKEKFHADHIEPLSKGGSNDKNNIQCLCPSCNLRKNAKDPIIWAQENGRLL